MNEKLFALISNAPVLDMVITGIDRQATLCLHDLKPSDVHLVDERLYIAHTVYRLIAPVYEITDVCEDHAVIRCDGLTIALCVPQI